MATAWPWPIWKSLIVSSRCADQWPKSNGLAEPNSNGSPLVAMWSRCNAAHLRMILHVNGAGQANLLKDVAILARGPGTDGSQFFLTFVPTPHLDRKHTIFGEVVEGKGTMKALEEKGTRQGKPTEPLWIKSATIIVE